jgi:hypothetical protein
MSDVKFEDMTDEEYELYCLDKGWNPYPDYQEINSSLIELKNRIIDFQKEVPPEFEETFKKRFKDILA